MSFPMEQPDPAEIAEQVEAFARGSARVRETEERGYAPDSPFPLHPFDPAEGRPDECAAWRVVHTQSTPGAMWTITQGGDRQLCAYAQSDPVHLESARTPVNDDGGLIFERPVLDSGGIVQGYEQVDPLGPKWGEDYQRRHPEGLHVTGPLEASGEWPSKNLVDVGSIREDIRDALIVYWRGSDPYELHDEGDAAMWISMGGQVFRVTVEQVER